MSRLLAMMRILRLPDNSFVGVSLFFCEADPFLG